jgi:putative transposase
MGNTFCQLYVHHVFAVKWREALIDYSWEEELYKYITGIVENQKQKMIAINGMPDHLHFLTGMTPSCCIADLMREVKKSTNDFIKERQFTQRKFNWQEGYGAFTVSHTDLTRVAQYIMNQKEHHRHKKFKDEYGELLKEYNIRFEEKYLFDWIFD